MATLPEARVVIDDEAGALAGGTDLLTVIACVAQNADGIPRVFASTKGLLTKHGYSAGVDYCASHFEETRKPVIFVPIPSAAVGTISAVDSTGKTGTSAITVTGPPADEVSAIATVTTGGTVGTAGIEIALSLDGGRSTKAIRLGTGNSYAIPYLGITLHFGAGTLVTGDVVKFAATAPHWDQAGLAAARAALVAQQKQSRSWLVIGDLAAGTDAANVLAEVNAYETANDRFIFARAQVRDRNVGEDDPTWVAAIGTAFSSIDAQRRIDLGAGRGFKLSPITGWRMRRPVQWAASIREYQHDVQIPTFRKSDGPLDGWSLEDANGQIVEHDERSDGGLLAARFTCFRTFANGPAGCFIALSLTRASEGSLLSRTHNMAVADVACSVCQAETENAIGQVLELNKDGTGTDASLVVLEERVNSALAIALLQAKTEGKRASAAKWQASRTDILNEAPAELTGTLDLRLGATLEKISTRVRVATAGS